MVMIFTQCANVLFITSTLLSLRTPSKNLTCSVQALYNLFFQLLVNMTAMIFHGKLTGALWFTDLHEIYLVYMCAWWRDSRQEVETLLGTHANSWLWSDFEVNGVVCFHGAPASCYIFCYNCQSQPRPSSVYCCHIDIFILWIVDLLIFCYLFICFVYYLYLCRLLVFLRIRIFPVTCPFSFQLLLIF